MDEVFTAVAGSGQAFRGRIVEGPSPQRLTVRHFTEDYLRMYGITPVLGRGFSRDDCDPSSPLVALLGYAYWQTEYGGRSDVLGATIRLDDEIATIVGVLPASFHANTPVSIPLRVPGAEYNWRGTGRVLVEGRCTPVSLSNRLRRNSGHERLTTPQWQSSYDRHFPA